MSIQEDSHRRSGIRGQSVSPALVSGRYEAYALTNYIKTAIKEIDLSFIFPLIQIES